MKDLALRTHVSLSSRWHALTLRVRAEDGQSTVEYLGVIVVVVAIVVVLIKAAPSIGDTVVSEVREQLKQITG